MIRVPLRGVLLLRIVCDSGAESLLKDAGHARGPEPLRMPPKKQRLRLRGKPRQAQHDQHEDDIPEVVKESKICAALRDYV